MSSSSDSCNSRHFSWIMKSCFPNPHHPHHPQPYAAIAAAAAATATSPVTNISALPDDILLECLSRVPHSSLPSLPSVCRRWAHLLDSQAFHSLRRNHNLLHLTLFSISVHSSTLFTASHRLDYDSSWRVSSFVPSDDAVSRHGSLQSLFSHSRLAAIGRKIYIIGREAMLRCDTWTGTLVPKSGMLVQRKKFAVAVVDEKLYIAGGCSRSAALEEYDPVEDTWRVVSHGPRRRYGCVGASADGLFYVIGGLKIGNSENEYSNLTSRVAGAESVNLYASSMDVYDVSAGVWLRSRAVPGGGCVVAACAAGGFVYVLSSHAVEVSFWRFNGMRKSANFGEWCRMKSPPLPAQVRLDSTVRFSCVAVGEEKVVLIQVMGCIDDLLRRGGRNERGLKEGLVLIYDCPAGDWTRGADLPEVIRRAACVCVTC
ncbi:OLC1v1005104C1 [Oldenlandia corymbosa var. corymbosa]|uniref:OLC1v1005104C1 n=1 Tax=Oldenlandia corymbosa var. corymbosa TaxID=529605 RepID=A0AAV1DGK2_OLDCO|nr:OLC1v1005104C1 [Oldenlandia corymbosa var. corymbosa]